MRYPILYGVCIIVCVQFVAKFGKTVSDTTKMRFSCDEIVSVALINIQTAVVSKVQQLRT